MAVEPAIQQFGQTRGELTNDQPTLCFSDFSSQEETLGDMIARHCDCLGPKLKNELQSFAAFAMVLSVCLHGLLHQNDVRMRNEIT